MFAVTRDTYGYVSGNPLNVTDPSGRNPLLVGGAVALGDVGVQLVGQGLSGCGVSLRDVDYGHALKVGVEAGVLDFGLGAVPKLAEIASARGALSGERGGDEYLGKRSEVHRRRRGSRSTSARCEARGSQPQGRSDALRLGQ